MEKIHLDNLPINELIYLESACRMLYSKEENEYLAFKGQLSPSGIRMYKDSLEEMEKKVRKYSEIRNALLNEIGFRVQNIEINNKDMELKETNNENRKES